jgi:hypothetical protein
MKIIPSIPFCLLLGATALAQGTVIFITGFETSGDTWNYTLDPDVNENAGGDTWDIVTNMVGTTFTADSGSRFWGGRDVGGTAVGSNRPWIVFNDVDVSGYNDVTVSFSYFARAFTAGDNQIGYTLLTTTNGNATSFGTLDKDLATDMSEVADTTVLVKLTTGTLTHTEWQNETINIDDNVTNLSLALYGFANAGTRYLGFDSVSVAGTPVPEPSTFAALLGAITLGLVVLRRRRIQ